MRSKVILIASALTLLAGQAFAQPADKAVLMLNWYYYGEHAPFVLGVEKGYYKDEGIDLEIQEGRGSGATIQAIGAGTAAFGLADVSVMINAVARGAPIKAVGVLQQRTPGAVVARADRIKDTRDLVGKTIAVTPGDAVTPFWPLYLSKIGLAEADVATVAGDAKTKLNAVINRQADGLIGSVTDQGARLPSIINAPVTVLRYADAGVNLVGLGIVVSNSTISARGNLVARFMRATTRALEEAERDPQGAIDIFLKAQPNVGLPEAQLLSLKYSQALYRANASAGGRPFQMDPALITESIDTMSRYGVFTGTHKGDPAVYYTSEFLP